MPPIFTRREFGQLSIMAALVYSSGSRVVAAERNVPCLTEVQRPPEPLPATAPSLSPVLVDAKGQTITRLADWQARRAELRQQWREFLGFAEFNEKHAPKLQVVKEDQDAGVVRQLVRYEIEPGITTEAYVLRPKNPPGKCPAAAVFHSTVNHSIRQPAGLGPDPEKAFGLKLTQRGVVTICPRNFLWPDNEHIAAQEETQRFQQRHPRAKGMAKMLYDAIVAVNILEQLPEVDHQRIGAVGHSLGAKEVLYLAAFDERIRVTVSSEGGIGTAFSNWDAPWYLGPAVKQSDFKHEHHELLAMTAPRAFLLIGGDSADGDRGWPFITAALPVYRLFGDRVPVGLYNHKRGHAVPPECERRIYEWFDAYL